MRNNQQNNINTSPNKKIERDNLNGLKPVACIIVSSLSFLSLFVTKIAAANAASGATIGIIGGIVRIENLILKCLAIAYQIIKQGDGFGDPIDKSKMREKTQTSKSIE